MSPAFAALTPERRARLYLSLVVEPGDHRIPGLLAAYGPVRLADDLRRGGDLGLSDTWRIRVRTTPPDPDRVAAAARELRMRWVCPGDDEWPRALDDLDHVTAIGAAGGTPLGLWIRGSRHLGELTQRSVAIVGARAATTYGCDAASEFAADLCDAGITVVSGAAFGIDSAAHRGALSMRAPTIAILACGADVEYPRAHRALIARIAESGLVVSEQAPHASPTKGRFLTRNRLIAAVTCGTVVVEAARRSGALNTANWAAECGRVLMAVPGPITSRVSVGTHQLVRSGQAIVVTSGAEVREALAPPGAYDAAIPSAPATAFDAMSAERRAVLEALPATGGSTVDELARACGRTPDAVEATLGALEDGGWIRRSGDAWELARRADLSRTGEVRTVAT